MVGGRVCFCKWLRVLVNKYVQVKCSEISSSYYTFFYTFSLDPWTELINLYTQTLHKHIGDQTFGVCTYICVCMCALTTPASIVPDQVDQFLIARGLSVVQSSHILKLHSHAVKGKQGERKVKRTSSNNQQ